MLPLDFLAVVNTDERYNEYYKNTDNTNNHYYNAVIGF